MSTNANNTDNKKNFADTFVDGGRHFFNNILKPILSPTPQLEAKLQFFTIVLFILTSILPLAAAKFLAIMVATASALTIAVLGLSQLPTLQLKEKFNTSNGNRLSGPSGVFIDAPIAQNISVAVSNLTTSFFHSMALLGFALLLSSRLVPVRIISAALSLQLSSILYGMYGNEKESAVGSKDIFEHPIEATSIFGNANLTSVSKNIQTIFGLS